KGEGKIPHQAHNAGISPPSRSRLTPCRQLQASAPQLGGERHRAGAAARTAHRYQDVLLLLLVEISAVEHLSRLLLEQLVERKVRGDALTLHRHIALRGDRGSRAHAFRCVWARCPTC